MIKIMMMSRTAVRKIFVSLILCACTFSLLAQQNVTVTGVVTDENGDPMPGATVVMQGSTGGAITDADGGFSINVLATGTVLEVSFVGYETAVVALENRRMIAVQLKPKADELEEVTIVAFGKQKKESVISSIQTVNTKELRVPSSNLTTAFSGRIAGMISYQTSGEPGYDNAQFFIRGITSFGAGKVDPLILIDNVEMTTNDLSRLHPDDIASFSILKDATATALYGARGANGVILITTKEGREGSVKVSIRVENSFSSPTTTIKMTDPITYMKLANEAARTRNPLAAIPYQNEQIDYTERGVNPYAFPAVDWMGELTKNTTVNQRANLNISGGGKVARYYIAGSFAQDNGILKVDKRNNFNNNINMKKYLIRSNININMTSSTEAIVRLHGTFDDYIGPISGGSDLYQKMLKVSPVRFPAYFPDGKNYDYAKHILFGGYESDIYLNPYAEMLRGYRQESSAVMMAQIEVKQSFDKWVKGLSGRVLGNTTRNSLFNLTRAYSPFYYQALYDRSIDDFLLQELNSEGGTDFLRYSPGNKNISSSVYTEASIAYNRTFGKHGVSGMLVGIARSSMTANATELSESLPKRNLGLSGRFTYSFEETYFGEFNFGYNGSEKFDEGHRWGFFPSVGVGWMVSNESFWKNISDIDRFISKLKIRGTYGLVGNDEIGSTRFFYLSNVTIGGGQSYRTGYEFGKTRSGASIANYPNSEIGWEIAYKSNLGIELSLLKDKIEILADIYQEHRTNILQPRADIPSTMGLWNTPQVNVGEAKGKGIDLSIDYNQAIGEDYWITARGNFTYARSVYEAYEEPDYSEMPWRSRIGLPVSQQFGYAAERLFIDQGDVDVSPRQDFGEYIPGDIKYKNMNDDQIINSIDQIPIGYPTTPEINYGFGVSAGIKNFDVSFFFQGIARSSFWIDADAMTPFVRRTDSGTGKILETGLAQFIVDDYWSEASQNPNAAWPRLSNYVIDNNTKRNTWFMRNRQFLRLKSVEAGYTLPKDLTQRLRIEQVRFYVSGTNLLNFSKFTTWDVEMGGNGLGYPLQRVINLGINVSF